ncbi:hypothetical protein GYMLUDRAFT_252839 [Collybiopsis luxurians FD-317 M1]|uniref:Uncharacterized protein n=1 Tax=Collybiopsis luxurians FD-317 M1 TaxID=944289 RepID=A0A0D0BYT0_9AGAR|nr:hypothetical protein GYMLUDRAFT_252839 [Collybiopsis luxurians FD-317 M1]
MPNLKQLFVSSAILLQILADYIEELPYMAAVDRSSTVHPIAKPYLVTRASTTRWNQQHIAAISCLKRSHRSVGLNEPVARSLIYQTNVRSHYVEGLKRSNRRVGLD